MRKALIIGLIIAPTLLIQAQSQTYVSGQLITAGGSLPGTCNVGEVYLKNTATIGIYYCSASNTWTLAGSVATAPLTGTGATVTTSTPLISLTQTWNNGSIDFTGIIENITQTANATGSRFMSFQRNGTEQIGFGTNLGVGGSVGIGTQVNGVAINIISPSGAAADIIMQSGVDNNAWWLRNLGSKFAIYQANTGNYLLSLTASRFAFSSTQIFGWSSNSNSETASDTGLARNAAGIVEVNNGTAGTLAALKALTYNGLTLSTTTGTFTLANAKTFVVNNGLTLSGTDSTVMTFPSTSATIARTDAANTFTGTQTFGAMSVGVITNTSGSFNPVLLNVTGSSGTPLIQVGGTSVIGLTTGSTNLLAIGLTSSITSSADVFLARSSAGVLDIGSTASCATAANCRDLRLRHLIGNGTAPTVANTSANSCGTTAATIAGTDSAGKITVGATSGTSCTITFGTAWGNAPACATSDETSLMTTKAISTTTTLIISATAFVAGDVIAYNCIGY